MIRTRSPRPAEKKIALDFQEAHPAALENFCLALLNRNAFLYVD